MSDIVLSAGVRQNLLSLQNTAHLMSITQNRLATGKKVNSALDNPTNFFTSAALNSRANDLGALLDSMSNGIKTLQAADNGITAITKTIEQMQSTLRQARQDKSFKSTSYSIDPNGAGNLSFLGGSIGATPVNVALRTGGTAVQSSVTAGAPYQPPTAATSGVNSFAFAANATAFGPGTPATSATQNFTFGGPMIFDDAGDELEFTIDFDNSGTPQTFTITATEVEAALGLGVTTIASAQDLADIINDMGIAGGTVSAAGATLTFTSATNGVTSQIDVTGVSVTNGGGADTLTNTSGISAVGPINGADSTGDTSTFQISVDGGGPVTVTLDASVVSGVGNLDGTIDNINEFTAALQQALTNAGVNNVTVANNGTNVTLTSNSGGINSNVTITAATPDADGGGNANTLYGLVNGVGTTGLAAQDRIITISDGVNTANITLTAANAATAAMARGYIASELIAQGVTGITVTGAGNNIDLLGQLDGSNDVTVGGAGANAVFGVGYTTVAATAGTPSTLRTVDSLVAEINSDPDLVGKIRASNDNGRLRIENLSTADLTVSGYSNTTGQIDGTAGTATIGGNTVRANFVAQFNGYIDQLNKLSDDASFNGVNLLRGDKLKITFNEAGTSTIEIQAKDANGNNIAINTSTLEILQATNPEFDSDDLIDAKLTVLGNALANLRAQGSSFGSNLSIVQNRQDFTKAMINTLQTGADNLVLADSNEEGANMLALQTRQQLSTTALSLSAQADQAVLRLFG